MQILKLILVTLFLFVYSCTKEKTSIEIIEDKEIELQMNDAYFQGIIALEQDDGLTAAQKFSEAELLFPQSEWAPKASLMSAYSYYFSEYYADAIYELERFLKTYPNHPRTDYAYYLLAITYYDQIVDETKDLGSLLKSKEYFELIIKKFPETEYAIDSSFKIELLNEVLASKEMYLARFYFEKEKWVPAINRFKLVVEKYDQTIFVEEALHRLVEIHYKIGLEDEAKKYAYVLGYNYQSSQWYENTYKVFNKNYTKPITKIKNQKSLIERIKSKLF
tara:strand:+ start:16349 stop:17179 length:831 start_codon:yes stop_codon:yes gene_type:complete